MTIGTDVSQAIRAALLTPEPRGKVMAARGLARRWRRGELAHAFTATMPDRPSWPVALEILAPQQMPRRGRGGSERNRIALWHAIAHIEFVAIDLALDMAGRFGAEMGASFVGDFLGVAAEEAMHFALIDRHLGAFGSHYAALPVHDGLWQAALSTRGDVAARLAVVPMVLEARGLDVTPGTIERVRRLGDARGAAILERILADEIRHVRIGVEHFAQVCSRRGELAESCWKMLVEKHLSGALRPPFNDSARLAAGLSREMYAPIASLTPLPDT